MEWIIIYVFFLEFWVDKENTYGKYINNNLSKLKGETNFDLDIFYLKEKFNPNDLKNFVLFSSIDNSFNDEENHFISER